MKDPSGRYRCRTPATYRISTLGNAQLQVVQELGLKDTGSI
jgi:hypothetical protein